MGLSDLSGVFSRYFVVGFFLPAFFTLVALSQTLNQALLPAVYTAASHGAQIAVVGGAALAVGLALQGLSYQVMRVYEGYPLAAVRERCLISWLYDLLMRRQRSRFRRAIERTGLGTDPQKRVAEWRLDRRFPRRARESSDESLLLPTSFGNAVRAFERHSFLRWYLESIAIWTHIEMLLTDQEQQALADEKGTVAFFLNLSLLSKVTILVLVVDMIGYSSSSPSAWFLLIPAAIAVAAYRAAIGAAVNWGEVVRAAIDLHRLEAYAKLGLRAPRDFTDEHTVAWNLSQLLLTGQAIPDNFASPSSHAPGGPETQ